MAEENRLYGKLIQEGRKIKDLEFRLQRRNGLIIKPNIDTGFLMIAALYSCYCGVLYNLIF